VSISSPVTATVTCGQAGAGAFQATLNLSGLPDGVVSFVASHFDPAGNRANASTTAVKTIVTPPGAPTIGSASALDARAIVSFSTPASDGGSAITGYVVTSNPAGIT